MKIALHTNQLQELDQALEISNQIFDPSPKELQKYHDKNDWLNKINNGGLLVTAWNDNKIVGFSICHPKEQNFHIWNVGVLKDYRKLGIWKLIHEELQKFAKEKGYQHLTLNTYKSRFPGMYGFALDNGYVEYKTEGEKSFFTKTI
ncbi:MAG: GNAT family N-acetyltransferase [bacterium]|nr:GNAT family N-acetyltransferase [bacterium]